MSAHKKLMQARMQLQSASLSKSGNNKFAGYKYFELGDFLPEVQKILSGLDMCGVVSFTADTATLTLTDTEDNSQVVITSPMGSAALKGCHEVQNIGAVETYQRRYLWVTAMEIVEHDALDATTGSEEGKPANKTVKAVPAPSESGKSVAKAEWDVLSAQEQTFLTGIANEMIVALEAGNVQEAERLFYRNNLDPSEQTALWSRFNSTQKSAITSYHNSLKEAA